MDTAYCLIIHSNGELCPEFPTAPAKYVFEGKVNGIIKNN